MLDVKHIFIDFILYLQIILILNLLSFDIICFSELSALNSSTIYSKISRFFVTARLNTSYIYMIHILTCAAFLRGLMHTDHAARSSYRYFNVTIPFSISSPEPILTCTIFVDIPSNSTPLKPFFNPLKPLGHNVILSLTSTGSP